MFWSSAARGARAEGRFLPASRRNVARENHCRRGASMIRMGPHSDRTGPSSKQRKDDGELSEQREPLDPAADWAADWADISQGLRKDLGHQLHSQWIRPIQLGAFDGEAGTLDLFLPTE